MKNQYFIKTFLGDEVLSTGCIKISKKQFEENKKRLDAQFEEHYNDNETRVFFDIEKESLDAYTKTFYRYTLGVNEIMLIKATCKDGYSFR